MKHAQVLLAVMLAMGVLGAGEKPVGEMSVEKMSGPELMGEFDRLSGTDAAMAAARQDVGIRQRLAAIRGKFLGDMAAGWDKSSVKLSAEWREVSGASWYMTFDPVLISLGDEAAISAAKELAASADADRAAVGKVRLLAGEWYLAGDEAGQLKVAEAMQAALAGRDVQNEFLKQTVWRVFALRGGKGEAKAALCSKVAAIYPADVVVREEKQRVMLAEAAKVMKGFEGKPVVMEGVAVNAKGEERAFSMEGLKGKVVLVDFWATWCGPCKAELPRVKALYAKYHGRGLEMVSVSNDYTKGALVKYLGEDPAMDWVQLFDGEAAAKRRWHPITGRFGINAIPRVFLIDRKGVLRSVEGRETMEEMVPKLLAEGGE